MRISALSGAFCMLFVLSGCDLPSNQENPSVRPSKPAEFSAGPDLDSPYVIPGKAYDIVYDPFRGKVYASLNGPEYGVVVKINPNNGSIEHHVQMEGDAGPLALASDGSQLWVGVQSKNFAGLCMIDVATMTPGKPIRLDPNYPDRPIAVRLNMIPGTNGAVVASLAGTSRPTAAVYDEGMIRPEFVAKSVCSNMVYSGEKDVYFAFNNKDTGFELHELLVSDTGIQLVKSYADVIAGFDSQRILTAGGGRVYGEGGSVFDVKTRKVIHNLLPFTGVGICEANDRLFVVSAGLGVNNEFPFSHCHIEVQKLSNFEPGPVYDLPPHVRTVKGFQFPVKTGDDLWGRYYVDTCRPVLLLGENTLVVNNYGMMFLPVKDILQGQGKRRTNDNAPAPSQKGAVH